MFKNFTFKGVLYGIKKYWILVVAGILFFSAAGTVLSVLSGNASVEDTKPDASVTATRSFFIVGGESPEADVTDTRTANATLLIAVLFDTSCQQEMITTLCDKFSNEDIAKWLDVPLSDNYSVKILEGKLKIESVIQSSLINVRMTSANEAFSKAVITYYSDYIEANSSKYIGDHFSCEPISDIVVTREESEELFASETGSDSSSLAKNIVIFAMLGMVLAICVVAFIVLLKPTVSDIKGFEEFGITVFSEKFCTKGSGAKFTKDLIGIVLNKASASKVAVFTTLSNVEAAQNATEFLHNSDLGICFETVDCHFDDYDSFMKLKQYDGIILVESVGCTTYANIEKALSLFSKYEMEVYGTLLV